MLLKKAFLGIMLALAFVGFGIDWRFALTFLVIGVSVVIIYVSLYSKLG